MANVRTFWLVDDRDEVFDLMGKGTDFLHAPQGLGQSHAVSYADLYTQRRVTSKKANFQTIKGEMFFRTYADSNAFRMFINRAGQRVRLYQKLPDIEDEYYAYVIVSMIDRGEKDVKTGLLKCEIAFECITFWTKEVYVTVFDRTRDSTGTDEKYTYKYPYRYASAYNTSEYSEIVLTNNGDMPAPVSMTINGLSVSPEWSLNDQCGGLNFTVQLGTSVTIDSRDDFHVITSGDTVLDNFKRHEWQNYITVPQGTHTLNLKRITNVEVRVYEHYYSI